MGTQIMGTYPISHLAGWRSAPREMGYVPIFLGLPGIKGGEG